MEESSVAMTLRALTVWCLLLVLAVLNGGARDAWLSPRLGDPVGRACSTLLLCGLIFLATGLTIGWLRPATKGQALGVGALWLVLTLAFEFGVGHYGFRNPWPELFADYDLRRGRIWMAVLVVTLFAPLWAARLRGLIGPDSSQLRTPEIPRCMRHVLDLIGAGIFAVSGLDRARRRALTAETTARRAHEQIRGPSPSARAGAATGEGSRGQLSQHEAVR